MDISVEKLDVSYGAAHVLAQVDIKSHGKEFVGIIGPNGSGKSTLLKCIYRVLSPDNGCIRLDQEALEHMNYRVSARKMAVVAQHNFYNFEFTVKDIVLMGRSPHKRPMERNNAQDYKIVEASLKTVGLEAFADREFSTLSGGEQQRVILARALAQMTPCLILDEPTNHLDITHQLQMMRLVKSLDVTVISAIHDLNIAAMFCDRIYVLESGRIIAEGTPRAVLTKSFLKDVYQVDAEIIYDGAGQMHIIYL